MSSLFLCLWLAAGPGLASPDEVATTLAGLGPDADLVLMRDPAGPRPVRVLLATRVAASADRVARLIINPASYRTAMPAFRRVDVVSTRAGATAGPDLQVAWELEVPAWNLKGKLWLRPQARGADLTLAEGDFAPGLFHLRAMPGSTSSQSILIVEGYANLSDANWLVRKLAHRSPLVEPVMTVAAAYVMLRALADLAEHGTAVRPKATLAAAALSGLDGTSVGRRAASLSAQPRVMAAVRRRPDGRLARVEVAVPLSARPEDASGKSLRPESFRGLPGWKKITPAARGDECGGGTVCWAVESNLPFFALGGTWAITPQPWRARMVAGETRGAVLGLDFIPRQTNGRSTLVVSQHPRIDQAGYLPRRLIAAEPFLEQGLSLALTIVEAVALAPALEGM